MPDKLHFVPPVIAHRGASAYAPENTIAAFVKAAQLGMKWVEFDVMLSACGKPILFHDENLERTTNGKGHVVDYPYAYLRGLDAGSWFHPAFSGERIPSLTQALEFLQNANMSANIEIKPLPGEDLDTVLYTLQDVALYHPKPTCSILFSSFSLTALRAIRKDSAQHLIGLLMDKWLPDWQVICDDLSCVSVHLNHQIVTLEKAKKIKDTGRLLLCYTVNDPLRAKQLFSWGVDAVFSDEPDKILI